MVEWAPPAEGFKAPRSASEATVYLTSPLHPVALDLAQRTFARVLGAGTDHEESLSRAESLLQADAACKLLPDLLEVDVVVDIDSGPSRWAISCGIATRINSSTTNRFPVWCRI